MTTSRHEVARARQVLGQRLAELGQSARDALLTELLLPLAHVIRQCHARTGACATVGLAGAQGTGKSTLAALLQRWLSDELGLRTAVLSLDDYYLPRAARRELAARVFPLLATRGPPGTHDVAALLTTLRTLRSLHSSDSAHSVELLRFSKADDDRLEQTEHWVGPCDVVLLEGWCVGARPEPEAALHEPINELERSEDPDARFRRFVNRQLAQDYAGLWAELDLLVFLAAPDFAAVRAMRGQQEDTLRAAAAGSPGVMDDAQLTRFVQHFERVTSTMLRDAPGYADVVVLLDRARDVRDFRLRGLLQPGA